MSCIFSALGTSVADVGTQLAAVDPTTQSSDTQEQAVISHVCGAVAGLLPSLAFTPDTVFAQIAGSLSEPTQSHDGASVSVSVVLTAVKHPSGT